eukprot:943550-Prymnesium_polylepis.2
MVKLGDFGIVRQMDDTSDFAQTTVGTPYYLSPEVIEGKVRQRVCARERGTREIRSESKGRELRPEASKVWRERARKRDRDCVCASRSCFPRREAASHARAPRRPLRRGAVCAAALQPPVGRLGARRAALPNGRAALPL